MGKKEIMESTIIFLVCIFCVQLGIWISKAYYKEHGRTEGYLEAMRDKAEYANCEVTTHQDLGRGVRCFLNKDNNYVEIPISVIRKEGV